jgi:hypothetical protein
MASFGQCPAKLFNKVASHRQIGKAPAIIGLALPQKCSSKSGLNMSRLMKIYDLAAQCDVQSTGSDGKKH